MSLFNPLPLQSWNAYLGNLPSRTLCVSRDIPSSYSPVPSQCTAASAFVYFHMDSGVLQSAASDDVTMFRGVFSGTMLKTKIKGNETISLYTTVSSSLLQTALLMNVLMTMSL